MLTTLCEKCPLKNLDEEQRFHFNGNTYAIKVVGHLENRPSYDDWPTLRRVIDSGVPIFFWTCGLDNTQFMATRIR